jgi:hypothetical protein
MEKLNIIASELIRPTKSYHLTLPKVSKILPISSELHYGMRFFALIQTLLIPLIQNFTTMAKAKSSKKSLSKTDFNKEYKKIMKGASVLPAPEWNRPGDGFTQFSMYTQHTSVTSIDTAS